MKYSKTQITDHKTHLLSLAVDLTSDESVKKGIEHFGRLDVVVNRNCPHKQHVAYALPINGSL